MDRHELEFQIAYSSRLEKMMAALLSRIDRAIACIQLFLGTAVVTHIASLPAGALIALLAAYSFAYRPGVKSERAHRQKQKYDSLLSQASMLTESELQARFYQIQKNDLTEIGALCHAAHLGEEIRLGLTPSVTLSRYEKLIAWLAGDLPKPLYPKAIT